MSDINKMIKELHGAYYSLDFDQGPTILRLHRAVEDLFNFAGIEESLTKNNPDQVAPSDVDWGNSDLIKGLVWKGSK